MSTYRFLVATAISCVGLLIGFGGCISNILNYMVSFNSNFSTSSMNGFIKEITYYTSFGSDIGTLIGYVVVLFLGDKIGRQKTMFISSFIYIIGCIIKCVSPRNFFIFISGNLINGLAIGCLMVIAPIFIAEIAPPKSRGRYILYYFIITYLGYVLGNLTNGILSPLEKGGRFAPWKLAIIIEIIMAIIVTIIVFFIPKSPRWLCANKKDEQAVEVISKLHNSTALDSEVQEEFKNIQDEAAFNRSSSFGGLFSSLVRRRTIIVILMCIFQEIIGVQEVYYIQSQIISEIGFKDFIYTLMVYASSIGGLIVGIFLIDKVGRKSLLVVCSCLMMILLILIFIFDVNGSNGFIYEKFALLSCFLYTLCYQFSWCYIPMIYAAEVFPLRVRVKGVSLSYIINIIISYVMSFISTGAMKNIGTKVLLIYGGICLVITIISKLYFIESKNIKLEDMDNKFNKK